MIIRIDPHTRARMPLRGILAEEISEVVTNGSPVPAARGRLAKERVFHFGSRWGGKIYAQKKVKVVYVEEEGAVITVTAYAYYGDWGAET